jgi:hypothetical protein
MVPIRYFLQASKMYSVLCSTQHAGLGVAPHQKLYRQRLAGTPDYMEWQCCSARMTEAACHPIGADQVNGNEI